MKLHHIKRIIGLLLLVAGSSGYSDVTEKIAVSKDGGQIHFNQQGQGEPALIFVHGWGSEKSRWENQMHAFSQKYQVVSLDLAGFGESKCDRQNWTMEAFGYDVVSVLERLKIRNAVLIGHSMGAYAVLEAAKIAPERIIGLVPVDMLQNVEETYTADQVSERLVRFQAYVESPDVTVSTTGWMECIQDAMNYRNLIVQVLKQIDSPIHCINSDQQPTNITMARKYSKFFDAEIIKDVGHAVMMDAPEEFNRLLEKIIEQFVHHASEK